MILPNKALEFLKMCLAETGWNKGDNSVLKHKRFYRSGKLLNDLPEISESPLPPTQSEVAANPAIGRDFTKRADAWARTQAPEFSLPETSKEYETCQVCLRYFIDEDRMPKGFAGNALVDAFKLLPE